MQKKKLTVINEMPVFPLPNVVFFPKTLLPLHIFEQRYRIMVKDALTSNNLIAIALLKDGWEDDYFGTPAVHDIACVGKIQQTEKLYDGKYNIMLHGLHRARILKFVQDKPYRIAQVKYLKDLNFGSEKGRRSYETKDFIELLRRYLGEVGIKNLDQLLKLQTHSLESIVNQVASILDFTIAEKQELLELDYIPERYDKILSLLHERLQALRVARNVKFVPKDPSWN